MSAAQRDIETLTVLQALYNAIGEQIATNDPTNLRGRVNERYRALYEDTGATGFEVRVGGEKVGTYGFSKRKGQPERTVSELQVVDDAAIVAWCDASEEYQRWVRQYATVLAAKQTGELPDGIEVVERTIPATPDTIRPNGTLRINRRTVERARDALAGGGLAGFLAGGESH